MAVWSAAAAWKQLLLNALDSNANLKHSSFFQLATIGTNGRPANRTVVFRGFQEDSNKIQINTDCRSYKIEDLRHCPFAEICWYFNDSWEQFRINGRVDIIDGSDTDPVKRLDRASSSLRIEIAFASSSVSSSRFSVSFRVSRGTIHGKKQRQDKLGFAPAGHHIDVLEMDSAMTPLHGTYTEYAQREKAWFASSLRSRVQYLGPSPGLPCISEEPSQEFSQDPSSGPVGAFCLLVLDPEQVDYLNLKSNERLSFTSKESDDGGRCWSSNKINP